MGAEGGRGAAEPDESCLQLSPSCGARSPARGWDQGARAAPRRPAGSPHPPPGSRLPGGTSSCPGKGGGRQTDRATSPFSLLPNSARAHTKEGEETRELGGWFSCRGLDSSCDGGWRGRLWAAGRGDTGPGSRTPRCRGSRWGARGEHGCGAQRGSKGLRATGCGAWGKVAGLATPARTREQRDSRGAIQRAKAGSLRTRC